MDSKPEPKRRDREKTRSRIMSAAFDLFASRGYARTGMREIAEQAGVATSLIVRHFGTKAALFEQSLINAIHTTGYFIRDKRDFGVKMAQLLADNADARISAMVVLAIADPESQAVAQKVTRQVIIESLAAWLGPPNAHMRALHMLTLLNGFTIQMRCLVAEELAPDTLHWLARSLQAIVDEETAPK